MLMKSICCWDIPRVGSTNRTTAITSVNVAVATFVGIALFRGSREKAVASGVIASGSDGANILQLYRGTELSLPT